MILQTYKNSIKNTGKAFKKLIFYAPDECILCGASGDIVCNSCSEHLPIHKGTLCVKCGKEITGGELCYNCQKDSRPYEKGFTIFHYQDDAKKLMHDFKFQGKMDIARFFALYIYNRVIKYDVNIDIVTAVPMHIVKKFGKGYNPPKLIAKELSTMLEKPFHDDILKRTHHTKSMSTMHGIDRMAHSNRVYQIHKTDIKNKNILLIDDVSTTGATLHVCSEILIKHGANKVYVAAACGGI